MDDSLCNCQFDLAGYIVSCNKDGEDWRIAWGKNESVQEWGECYLKHIRICTGKSSELH